MRLVPARPQPRVRKLRPATKATEQLELEQERIARLEKFRDVIEELNSSHGILFAKANRWK